LIGEREPSENALIEKENGDESPHSKRRAIAGECWRGKNG
jgi:hypothetical protein